MDPNIDANTTPAPPQRTLRIFLVIVALIETVGSLSNLPDLFTGRSQFGSGIGQWIINTGLLILPLPAVAALSFAIKGQIDRAIMAIAVIVLVLWITYLPSLSAPLTPIPSTGVLAVYQFIQMVVFPVLAIAAIVLAARRQRLTLAAVLVSIPTILGVLAVIAFLIGIMIYGF
jgi:hypothetical protein